ncbi:MAG: hypothetical protein HYT30_02270 [Parcubacteria group bacterium]|nr:hypothetical protein [Parcubacteria group bacterium]
MKNYIIGGVIIVAIVGLMSWGKLTGEKKVAFWNNTQIACLPNGHTNMALHQHSDLVITVDGVPEGIPTNIGVSADCMSEVHTHDGTGKVHVEAAQAGVTHTLGDFLAVWGKTFDRAGYAATLTVDGAPNTDLGNLVLKDGQKIALSYVSTSQTASTTAH